MTNEIKLSKKAEIISLIINNGGSATFGQMLAIVEEKQLKTGNPLKNEGITKLVSYNMLLNSNYTNVVNNARIKEATANGETAEKFVAKENWFTTIVDSFNGSLIAKKSDTNCQYLKFICNVGVTKNLGYFVNGIEATEEQIKIIKQFKPTTAKAFNQGLENDVIVRTVKLEGIKQIKVGEEVKFAE